MSMTRDEIAAERERCFDGQKQPENEYYDGVWYGWLSRTHIARAEQAELRAENERLRERVRELVALLREAVTAGLNPGGCIDKGPDGLTLEERIDAAIAKHGGAS